MLTFLFWNLNKRPLEGVVSALTYQHQVDVLILAEWAIPTATMLLAVLLRPDLMDRFPSEELRILTEDGDSSLLSPSGLPDKAAGSDHLPVLFKLDL